MRDPLPALPAPALFFVVFLAAVRRGGGGITKLRRGMKMVEGMATTADTKGRGGERGTEEELDARARRDAHAGRWEMQGKQKRREGREKIDIPALGFGQQTKIWCGQGQQLKKKVRQRRWGWRRATTGIWFPKMAVRHVCGGEHPDPSRARLEEETQHHMQGGKVFLF